MISNKVHTYISSFFLFETIFRISSRLLSFLNRWNVFGYSIFDFLAREVMLIVEFSLKLCRERFDSACVIPKFFFRP